MDDSVKWDAGFFSPRSLQRIFLVELIAVLYLTSGVLNEEKVVGGTQGREFVIGFLENRRLSEPPAPRVIVTSASSVDVAVTIEVPADFTYPPVEAVLSPGDSLVHQFDHSLHMSGSGREYKGVRVVASGDVTVQGASMNDHSSDAYLALPTAGLGLDHYVMCYLYTEGSGNGQGPTLIGIVAVYPDTFVTLTFQIDGMALESKMAGVTRLSSRVFRLFLPIFETLQLQGVEDLTGTRVQSTRPVTILSGTVWSSVGVEYMGDHMIEQVPPVTTWGHEFYTIPIATRTAGDIFRILAHMNQTVVYVSSTALTTSGAIDERTLDAGEFFDLQANSSESYHIVGSHALLLGQFCKGYAADDNRLSDPYFSLMPALNQYSDDYYFSTVGARFPASDHYSHYVGVSVRESSVDEVTLDDQPLLSHLVVERLYHKVTGRLVLTLNISAGSHHLYSPSARVGAILYGLNYQEGYGHPLGQRLNGPGHSCWPVETKLNDGLDNDCDGAIDEEVVNGIDDDADGLIDEDIGEGSDTARFTAGSPESQTAAPVRDSDFANFVTTVDPRGLADYPDVSTANKEFNGPYLQTQSNTPSPNLFNTYMNVKTATTVDDYAKLTIQIDDIVDARTANDEEKHIITTQSGYQTTAAGSSQNLGLTVLQLFNTQRFVETSNDFDASLQTGKVGEIREVRSTFHFNRDSTERVGEDTDCELDGGCGITTDGSDVIADTPDNQGHFKSQQTTLRTPQGADTFTSGLGIGRQPISTFTSSVAATDARKLSSQKPFATVPSAVSSNQIATTVPSKKQNKSEIAGLESYITRSASSTGNVSATAAYPAPEAAGSNGKTSKPLDEKCDPETDENCDSAKEKRMDMQVLLAIVIPIAVLLGIPLLVCLCIFCKPCGCCCIGNSEGRKKENKGSQETMLPRANGNAATKGSSKPAKLTFSALSQGNKVSVVDEASVPTGQSRTLSRKSSRKKRDSAITNLNSIPLESRQQRRARRYGNRSRASADVNQPPGPASNDVILAMPKPPPKKKL